MEVVDRPRPVRPLDGLPPSQASMRADSMKTGLKVIGALAAAILALAMPAAANAQRLAIRNVRILPIKGDPIDSGTILIENGKIRALGANVPIPPGTTVLDGTGATAMPGIVDANAHFGLRDEGNEQASEVTPAAGALALAVPRSADFQHAVAMGITTALLSPGSANVVGGACAVVKTAGGTLRRILVRDHAGLAAALGQDTSRGNGGFLRAGPDSLTSIYLRRPNSRMAAVWELRNALDRAARSKELAAVRQGSTPLRISARIENDIRAALAIVDEFQVPHVTLVDGCEAAKVADQLAQRHVSVVLGPLLDPQTDAPESAGPLLNTAGLLADRGITVAFGSNSGSPAPLLHWA